MHPRPPSIESPEYETVDDLVSGLGVVGTAYEVLKFIYEFGKTSPIEYALEDIRREISRILDELDYIEDRLDIVTQRQVKAENLARIRAQGTNG